MTQFADRQSADPLRRGGVKSNESGCERVEIIEMQAIKGLIGLFLAAVAVFACGAWNDIRSQDRFAERTLHPVASLQVANATTTHHSTVDPAQQKVKNRNL